MTADPMRDLKVRIPLHYYVQLHTLKILRGKNMADALCEALDLYFATPHNADLRASALRSLGQASSPGTATGPRGAVDRDR